MFQLCTDWLVGEFSEVWLKPFIPPTNTQTDTEKTITYPESSDCRNTRKQKYIIAYLDYTTIGQ